MLAIVKHPAFEWSVLFLIFGSSITLCFEDIYLDENPRLQVGRRRLPPSQWPSTTAEDPSLTSLLLLLLLLLS